MSGAGRAAILIPHIGVGTALCWRKSRAFEIQQHSTSQASQCKSTLHILFFCFSKNMLTCQIKSPSLGSENLVPVTMVQLYHKLNRLLWIGTGILILISTSCGQVPKNFWAVPTHWKNPLAVIKFNCNDIVFFLDIIPLYPQGMVLFNRKQPW